LKTIEIKTIDIDEQISLVLDKIKIDKKDILSRCILCNSKIDVINKKDVREKVPERIYINHENFWLCKKCNKIYWKGTHYKKMVEKIDSLS
jgi:uncharacterized protein with PIN domain